MNTPIIKLPTVEGIEPVPGRVIVFPEEKLETDNGLMINARDETPAHRKAHVLVADPSDSHDEVPQGSVIYYETHAAHAFFHGDQELLTVDRANIVVTVEAN